MWYDVPIQSTYSYRPTILSLIDANARYGVMDIINIISNVTIPSRVARAA